MANRFAEFINDRTGAGKALDYFLNRKIPPGVKWPYTLGSATTTAFVVLLITGMLLTTHYQPSPETAYGSVKFIYDHVIFGSFIHNLHFWAASAMVVLVALHMTRVFYFGAYKYPREMTWITGSILLVVTLAFAFSGYLLPWDQKAYWTTVLLSRMAGTAPFVGGWATTLVQDGQNIGAFTVTQLFAFHVILLPVLTVAAIGVHMFLVIRHGISNPPRRADEPYAEAADPTSAYREFYDAKKAAGKPFFHNVLDDAIVSLGLVLVLCALAIYVPHPLEQPANPIGVGFAPRPEWYFLWLFQLLRLFPGKLEPVGVLGVPLVLVLLLMGLPFLDRGPRRHPMSRPVTVGVWTLGGIAVLWLTVLGAGEKPPSASGGALVKSGLSAQALAGEKVFQTYSCTTCHKINGVGGDMGPDLTHVGSRHNLAFFTKLVRNPQSEEPGSPMPPFTQIPEAQYKNLVQFLSELK